MNTQDWLKPEEKIKEESQITVEAQPQNALKKPLDEHYLSFLQFRWPAMFVFKSENYNAFLTIKLI